eukprot:6191016-Pleurochrysis_carterae.AAC.6
MPRWSGSGQERLAAARLAVCATDAVSTASDTPQANCLRATPSAFRRRHTVGMFASRDGCSFCCAVLLHISFATRACPRLTKFFFLFLGGEGGVEAISSGDERRCGAFIQVVLRQPKGEPGDLCFEELEYGGTIKYLAGDGHLLTTALVC